jgi:hypothetical protein
VVDSTFQDIHCGPEFCDPSRVTPRMDWSLPFTRRILLRHHRLPCHQHHHRHVNVDLVHFGPRLGFMSTTTYVSVERQRRARHSQGRQDRPPVLHLCPLRSRALRLRFVHLQGEGRLRALWRLLPLLEHGRLGLDRSAGGIHPL